MEKQKNIPQLRFPEFNGEWEKKNLGEIAYKNSSNIAANAIEDNFGDYIVYGASGVLKRVNFYREEEEYISIVKDGAGVGRVFLCQANTSVLGTLDIIKPTDTNLYYLFYLLQKTNFLRYITGSTIPHIYFSDYKAEKILVPCIKEQTKIAKFLVQVDKKIKNFKNKKKLLEQYKKGVMQKLFSQELRFKDEKGEEFPKWENKKLGEIAELTSSKRIYLNDYVKEGIPFYRGKEITELKQNIQPEELLYISEKSYLEIKEIYGVPSINDILITAVGTLGNILRIKNSNPFYFKDGNLIWIRKINEVSEFLEILLDVFKNDIETTSIGSTQRALTMVELRKLILPFPTKNEQIKIVNFISIIDKKINLTKLEIEKTERWKKGLLQKMFC